ncbi:MAG: hypothetical protein HC831_26095 [Chloroflexia bacterium]|nr:hypothetical protein [Chloroflexia bacterium]
MKFFCNMILVKKHSLTGFKNIIIIAVFQLFTITSFSQVKKIGLPYIQNYLAEDYKASKQNWMADQDKRGVIYFGNNMGVLEYDGHDWRLIPLTEKSRVVRAVKVAKDGKIYIGSTAEFGYLAPDSIGQMKYFSLFDKIEDPNLRKFKGLIQF